MESVPAPMHVLCPSCATAYEIETLARPRRLRCAKCGTEWRELPPAPEGVRAPDAGPAGPAHAATEVPAFGGGVGEPEAREALSVPAVRRPPIRLAALRGLRREDALLLGLWILSLAVIAGALFAFWHWRVAIAHRWPPSLRLYRLLPRPPRW